MSELTILVNELIPWMSEIIPSVCALTLWVRELALRVTELIQLCPVNERGRCCPLGAMQRENLNGAK